MTLLLFVVGIVLAFGIARYNESNKLFWQLAVSLTLGYACMTMIENISHTDNESKASLMQVSPTQVLDISSGNVFLLADENVPATVKLQANVPVGQGTTPAINETSYLSSEVFGRTRDQPRSMLIRPPEYIVDCLDSS